MASYLSLILWHAYIDYVSVYYHWHALQLSILDAKLIAYHHLWLCVRYCQSISIAHWFTTGCVLHVALLQKNRRLWPSSPSQDRSLSSLSVLSSLGHLSQDPSAGSRRDPSRPKRCTKESAVLGMFTTNCPLFWYLMLIHVDLCWSMLIHLDRSHSTNTVIEEKTVMWDSYLEWFAWSLEIEIVDDYCGPRINKVSIQLMIIDQFLILMITVSSIKLIANKWVNNLVGST